MNKCGIYKITNKINNKSYIGQSVNIPRRVRIHFWLKNNDKPLYRAIEKYGQENFVIEILEYCSKDNLNEKEIYYINHYNTLVPSGYNLTTGGESSKQVSDETKQKMKTSHADYNGNKNPFFGKQHSELTKQKLKDCQKGISIEDRCGKQAAENLKKANVERNKNSNWYTNGINNKFIQNGQNIPEGFYKGRTITW